MERFYTYRGENFRSQRNVVFERKFYFSRNYNVIITSEFKDLFVTQ